MTYSSINDLKKVIPKSDYLLIGLGNIHRGDDGWAIDLVKKLNQYLPEKKCICEQENDPLEIVLDIVEGRIQVEMVIFLDAVDFEGKPGELRVFRLDDIKDRALSTHKFPLKTLMGLLDNEGVECILLGLQPTRLDYGSPPSREVEEALHHLIQVFPKP